MINVLRELLKRDTKCKINIEIDETKDKTITEVEGNLPSILMGIAVLVTNLKDSEIPEELIKGAVDIGLKNNKVEKKTKIIEKEIIIEDEVKARKIEKFLKELEEK